MIGALLSQDVRLALGGGAVLPLIFAAIVLSLFGVGLAPDPAAAAQLAPSILWVTLLLSALLSLERLIEPDARDGTLDLLILELGSMPVALVKLVVHWLTTLVPLMLLLPLTSLFLALPLDLLATLALSLVIGSPAVSALAVLGAALALSARRGAVLAPVLLLPLLLPLFLFAIGAVARQAEGGCPAEGLYFLTAGSIATVLVAPPAAAGALRLAVE